VVKGEVRGCDLVGVRHGEETTLVVCELKLAFKLELVLHAVDRAAISDEVWLAAAQTSGRSGADDFE
jgi:hypothetical protein